MAVELETKHGNWARTIFQGEDGEEYKFVNLDHAVSIEITNDNIQIDFITNDYEVFSKSSTLNWDEFRQQVIMYLTRRIAD